MSQQPEAGQQKQLLVHAWFPAMLDQGPLGEVNLKAFILP
jgi:hypothetical protein